MKGHARKETFDRPEELTCQGVGHKCVAYLLSNMVGKEVLPIMAAKAALSGLALGTLFN